MTATPVLRAPGRRAGVLLALVSALALLLSACSGATAPAASPSGLDTANPTKITVGAIPVVDTAAFRLGISKGFFAEKGLEVSIQDASGGAAIVPAVMAGGNQIGFSNLSSLIVAQERGLPLRLIAAGAATTGDTTKDYSGITVKAGSSIASPKDLAGKRVAVNNLKSISDTTVYHAVASAGGDPAAVKFVEMPFAEMSAQLQNGQVDAAWSVEPFTTIMQKQGAEVLSYNLAGFDKNLQVGGFFTSTQYATQHPAVVTAFNEALAKSNQYATDNPDELRAFLSSYLKVDPAVRQDLVLPTWPSSIDEAALQKLADEGQKYGMTTSKVDVAGLLR